MWFYADVLFFQNNADADCTTDLRMFFSFVDVSCVPLFTLLFSYFFFFSLLSFTLFPFLHFSLSSCSLIFPCSLFPLSFFFISLIVFSFSFPPHYSLFFYFSPISYGLHFLTLSLSLSFLNWVVLLASDKRIGLSKSSSCE